RIEQIFLTTNNTNIFTNDTIVAVGICGIRARNISDIHVSGQKMILIYCRMSFHCVESLISESNKME
ncbi:hypothetical protein ABTB92_20175, partial [Acinetobacter baumannii]